MKPVSPLALIVDDSPLLALQLGHQLAALGIDSEIAVSAAQLSAMADTATLIFIELQLFASNGFALTRQLAARVTCPLILVTGTGRSTDLRWGLQAGATAVLTRPLLAPALKTILQQLQIRLPHDMASTGST